MNYYKAVRLDKTSHYDKSTIWRMRRVVKADNPDFESADPCGRGIHCSPTLLHAVGYQTGPSIYCIVHPINVIASNSTKSRCDAVRTIRWLRPEEQDEIAGLKLWEANHAVNPLDLPVLRVQDKHKQWLKDWASVRASVWDSVWDSVRDSVWASVWASVRDSVRDSVWASVWDSVRDSVWASVWDSVRASVWVSVRDSVWDSVRASVWVSVRDSVWDSVYAYIGGLFPQITSWRYAESFGPDPWRPLLNLWYDGFLPSFDGDTWRLHAGKEAAIVFES